MLTFLYLYGVKQGDTQMTIVGLLVAALFFFISRSKPLPQLSDKRPASRIFTVQLGLSLAGQFIVHLASIVLVVRLCAPHIGANDPSMERDGDFRPNVINTAIFLL